MARGRPLDAPIPRAIEDGVLVAPSQEFGDIVENFGELGQKTEIQAKQCTTQSDFAANKTDPISSKINVMSWNWAIPHPTEDTTTNKKYHDARGEIVEFHKSSVSFKNISASPITVHANCPVAMQHMPGKIYARLAGFRRKIKGKTEIVDSMKLNAGQIATFKINWMRLPNEYTPVAELKKTGGTNNGAMRINMTQCQFAVEIDDINPSTGTAHADDAVMLSIIPKAAYTKRQVHPTVAASTELGGPQIPNFFLEKIGAGASYLYDVNPVPIPNGELMSTRSGHAFFEKNSNLFSDPPAFYTRSARSEGNTLGVNMMQVKIDEEGHYSRVPDEEKIHQEPDESQKDYLARVEKLGITFLKALCVSNEGNTSELRLASEQTPNARLIVPGLNLTNGSSHLYPDIIPNFGGMSYFAWMPHLMAWVQWSEFLSGPASSSPFEEGFPVALSTTVPLMVINEAVYMPGVTNEFGQRIGNAGIFGTTLAAILSILVTVGKASAMILPYFE
jgi:hypothetical protein